MSKMKIQKIKKFVDFSVNESQSVNEDKAWYTEKGYVSSPEIPDKETLIKKIEEGMNADIDRFLKANNVPTSGAKIVIDESRGREYFNLETDPADEKDLGPIFSKTLTKLVFGFFSGREIQHAMVEGEFMFKPYCWTTLNISYELYSRGSNGMGFPIADVQGHPSNNVWFDIFEGKFYDENAWHAKNK